MIDIDATVRSLAERTASRKEIAHELDSIASAAETRVKRYARAMKDQRSRAAEERVTVNRIGRLLFFLHHGSPALGATAADHLLYDLLRKCRD